MICGDPQIAEGGSCFKDKRYAAYSLDAGGRYWQHSEGRRDLLTTGFRADVIRTSITKRRSAFYA